MKVRVQSGFQAAMARLLGRWASWRQAGASQVEDHDPNARAGDGQTRQVSLGLFGTLVSNRDRS